MALANPTQTCNLVNINGTLVAFCQTSDFKKYVRDAVNNEMFWRTLLDTWRIDSKIKDEVNNQLSNTNKIRDIAKTEAHSVTDKLVKNQLDNYTMFQIPSHVSKALSEQITGFLNNNIQMNQILSQHSQNQNQSLYNSAMETLNRIVNEPQYHMVTTAHLGAIDMKFNKSLQCIEERANSELARHTESFNNQLHEFNKKVANELKIVTETNTRMNNIERQVMDLSNRINNLEQSNTSLKIINGFCIIVITCIGLSYMRN